jgi:hypothetical protein
LALAVVNCRFYHSEVTSIDVVTVELRARPNLTFLASPLEEGERMKVRGFAVHASGLEQTLPLSLLRERRPVSAEHFNLL